MTEKKRIWFPGASYHITARGNRRNDIFKDGEDFQVYITLMKGALEYYKDKYRLACFCLMDNHVHLLIQTTDLHLKEFITRVNSIYAKYFNNKYNYIGHLYQDKYYSELIENDSQMLETSRYIHLNPVRAKMVKRPEEYLWSSYSMVINKSDEKIIDTSLILSYFKDNNPNLYKNFVEAGIKDCGISEDDNDGISS
jgi:putative transposase